MKFLSKQKLKKKKEILDLEIKSVNHFFLFRDILSNSESNDLRLKNLKSLGRHFNGLLKAADHIRKPSATFEK